MEEWLKTADAARLTGVGTTAIKRWADEGRLACSKTPGGHRRFRRVDIEHILAEERGDSLDEGMHRWIQLAQKAGASEFESELLLARVREGSWYQVAGILGKVITEIGMMWSREELTIIEEHRASERIRRALANVSERMVVNGSMTAVLVAAPEEAHTLGLSLVEIVLREAGFETIWLGARVPVSEFEALLSTTHNIALIAASASLASENELVLGQFARDLEATARSHDTALVLGGDGHWPDVPNTHRFRSWKAFFDFAKSLAGS